MNKEVKEFLYQIYNIKSKFFWRSQLATIKLRGRNIVLDKVRIISADKTNLIEIGDGARLHNVTINIGGINNRVLIGDGCSLNDTIISTENNLNLIDIGKFSTTTGGVDISAIEGTKVIIGEDAMISKDVYIATGDGHSILGTDGSRTNKSDDIIFGKHVWVGFRSSINKGVMIPDNSVIGCSAVVNRSLNKMMKKGSIIAGNPARVIRTGCGWNRKRI